MNVKELRIRQSITNKAHHQDKPNTSHVPLLICRCPSVVLVLLKFKLQAYFHKIQSNTTRHTGHLMGTLQDTHKRLPKKITEIK